MTPLFLLCDSCPQMQLGGSPAPPRGPPNATPCGSHSAAQPKAQEVPPGAVCEAQPPSFGAGGSAALTLTPHRCYLTKRKSSDKAREASELQMLLSWSLLASVSSLLMRDFFGVLKMKYYYWSSNSSHSCSAILKPAKSEHENYTSKIKHT